MRYCLKSVNEKKWVIPRIRFAGETFNISAEEALNEGAENSFAQKVRYDY
jgi:hypothetical protein